ncbi:peptidase S16 [Hankyongella ginsenosidimutans]|uniref:Peptidase S16 n=1 Tax=Hankyongella ginsenosidimutans TaxID=1763828 RepID=A0A4D7C546_9SPHN|nr:LON peptidase substrate-binding domain-containing protein [Hankyongella ginsenosidimutans]QCI78690.1 peptidase S16 [Hankyongella ginsenosidimutans]
MAHLHETDTGFLPSVLPIFPLAGAILLPRAELPLNIFEPRYLAMTRAALESHRLIGMVQPAEERGDSPQPRIYPVGCAGRIAHHEATKDGRILMTLVGVQRFRIAQELDVITPFRQVRADFDAFAGDVLEPGAVAEDARTLMVERLKRFLAVHNLQAAWDTIAAAPDDTLVSALCMICPFTPAERQALLEAPTLAARLDALSLLFEFASDPGGDAANPARH